MKLIDSEYNKLLSLLSTLSPSSVEDEVAKYVETYRDNDCIFQRDILGNIFLSLPNEDNKRPIMIAAHSDEIGLQVINLNSATL